MESDAIAGVVGGGTSWLVGLVLLLVLSLGYLIIVFEDRFYHTSTYNPLSIIHYRFVVMSLLRYLNPHE